MSENIIPTATLLSLLTRTAGSRSVPRPFTQDIALLDCYIAGTSYRELDDVEPHLASGDDLVLRREPDNLFDSRAIKILTTAGTHLGYVPRVKNQPLAGLMDAGKLLVANLVKKTWKNSWLKIDITIAMREV